MSSMKIELGLTVLLTEKRDWIRGKSIGLLTNHTGVDAALRSNYRLFVEAANCQLAAIFSPEHGLSGAVQNGITINNISKNLSLMPHGNVPVFSLYGQSMRLPPEQLEGIDTLVYDIQDVGVRYYTYISTLLYAMEAASNYGVEFIVADRPNPITCAAVEGNVLASGFESFVGIHTIPIRYGLTVGELAILLKSERVPSCRLKVVWMRGYKRRMWYDDTGFHWVPPSPNIPTLTTAVLYPGLCLFEGTNMSEGRGTTKPFEYIGAPWCDGERWTQVLNALHLPGVQFRPVVFTPAPITKSTKHAKQTCNGVAIHITDREHFHPVETALYMLSTLTFEYKDRFTFSAPHFDRLAGNSWLRDTLLSGKYVDEMQKQWVGELHHWTDKAKQYHTYKE